MNTTAAAQTVPAERIRPGRGVQRVNAYDADGRFVRQVTYGGTEAEARAFAQLMTVGRR